MQIGWGVWKLHLATLPRVLAGKHMHLLGLLRCLTRNSRSCFSTPFPGIPSWMRNDSSCGWALQLASHASAHLCRFCLSCLNLPLQVTCPPSVLVAPTCVSLLGQETLLLKTWSFETWFWLMLTLFLPWLPPDCLLCFSATRSKCPPERVGVFCQR